MKATLEFTCPEENEELYDAMHGTAYHGLVSYVVDKLRRFTKDFETEELPKALEDFRVDIFCEAAELGVKIHD